MAVIVQKLTDEEYGNYYYRRHLRGLPTSPKCFYPIPPMKREEGIGLHRRPRAWEDGGGGERPCASLPGTARPHSGAQFYRTLVHRHSVPKCPACNILY